MKSKTAKPQSTLPVAPELAADEGVYGKYELARIRKSPDNRKHFDEQALQELAASIKQMGVAQPILIRPVTPTPDTPEEYEIVAGERRYRASIIAELRDIPAMCRKLSDLDAAKIRILENLQREDPHPMEEADGYQQLMMRHGFSAEQLAGEVHKSKAYIYARLKLCALANDVRDQFMANKMPASTALLIARIPVPALQSRALDEVLKKPEFQGGGAMSYREAVAHLQRNYMLDLSAAEFDLKDAKLLPDAGSCSKCPKRSGNQPEVFADISADVCTDPDCFGEKKAAHVQKIIFTASKQGVPTFTDMDGLQEADAEGVLVRGDIGIGSMQRWNDWADYSKPAITKLSTANQPPIKAYLHTDGKLVPVFEKTALQLALEEVSVCRPVAKVVEDADEPNETAPNAARLAKMKAEEDAHKARQRVAERETAFRVNLYKQFRVKAAKGLSLQSLREFVKLVVIDDNYYTLPNDLLDVYGIERFTDADVCAYIDQAGLPEVQLILIDLVLGDCLVIQPQQVNEDGTIDDEYNGLGGIDRLAALHAMANHAGISPEMVRVDMDMSTVELKDLADDNISDFIRVNPQRINELKEFVLQERPHLLSKLEAAALANGYRYTPSGFVHADVKQVDEATVAGAAAAEVDVVPAPAVTSGEPANAQVPEGEIAAVEGETLAIAIAEPATKKAAPKTKKPAAPKILLSPATAWPFPKSSTAARDVPAATPSTQEAK